MPYKTCKKCGFAPSNSEANICPVCKSDDMIECLSVAERVDKVAERLVKAEKENAELREKIQEVKAWCEGYPVDIFPEPDLAKAKELLEQGGITLDSVSAYCMRYITDKIKEECKALKQTEDSGN